MTLASSLAIGIPAFFLAMDRTAQLYRPGFVRRVMRFAIPAGVVVGLAVLGTHLVATGAGLALAEARVLNTLVLLLTGLGLVEVLEWPLRGWRLAVVVAMAIGGALAFALPPVRDFFALAVPGPAGFGAAVGVSAAALAVVAGLTVTVRRERRLVSPSW